jgi:hypothetical protein
MQLQRVSRTIVCTWLRAARVPLDAVEVVVRRGEQDDEWPPALAFASFEATIKQVAGSLLNDDVLAEEGQLAQARVGQLRKAGELRAAAAQRKQEADAEFVARRRADQEKRRRVDQEAERRENALEEEHAAEQRRVSAEDARKRKLAAGAQRAEEKAVERQDRAARAARVTAEREALRDERKAVAAKEKVSDLDEELEETKAARKSNEGASR